MYMYMYVHDFTCDLCFQFGPNSIIIYSCFSSPSVCQEDVGAGGYYNMLLTKKLLVVQLYYRHCAAASCMSIIKGPSANEIHSTK